MQEFAIIIWPFKCQVSVVAAGLLILNVHCGTVFSCMDEKVVHSLGYLCPVRSVERVKKISVGYVGSRPTNRWNEL
jgi:hypothetical protein